MERTVRRLAWPLAIVSGTVTVVGLTIQLLTIDRPSVALWGFRGFEAIFAIETIAVGALIMSRRPENTIGPLFGLAGLLSAIQLVTLQYLVAGADGSLPLVDWASVVYAPIWVPAVAIMLGYVPLLFPDGHLVSPRWRWVGWLLLFAIVAVSALSLAAPNFGGGGSSVAFPYGALVDASDVWPLWFAAFGIFVVAIVGAVASLWVRWRRSTGVEREQLKWLAWAGGIAVAVLPFTFLPYKIVQVVFIFAIALMPLAVGVAVLRYRLYEIDAVISGTLVYGGLTAILAGLFAGVQRIIQGAFVSVTGNESDAAWAITALVLAAFFAPLKGALERFVARRFREPSARSEPVPATAAIDPVATAAATMPASDLEAMLRRVVREELAVAMRRTMDDG